MDTAPIQREVVVNVAVRDLHMMTNVGNPAAVAAGCIAVDRRVLEGRNPILFRIAGVVLEKDPAAVTDRRVAVDRRVLDGRRPIGIDAAAVIDRRVAVDAAVRDSEETICVDAAAAICVGAGSIAVDLAVADLQPFAAIPTGLLKIDTAATVRVNIVIVNRAVADLYRSVLSVDSPAIAPAAQCGIVVNLAVRDDGGGVRANINGPTGVDIVHVVMHLAARQIESRTREIDFDRIPVAALIVVQVTIGDREYAGMPYNCPAVGIRVNVAVVHDQGSALVVDAFACIMIMEHTVGEAQEICVVDAPGTVARSVIVDSARGHAEETGIVDTPAREAGFIRADLAAVHRQDTGAVVVDTAAITPAQIVDDA